MKEFIPGVTPGSYEFRTLVGEASGELVKSKMVTFHECRDTTLFLHSWFLFYWRGRPISFSSRSIISSFSRSIRS